MFGQILFSTMVIIFYIFYDNSFFFVKIEEKGTSRIASYFYQNRRNATKTLIFYSIETALNKNSFIVDHGYGVDHTKIKFV